MTRVKWILLLFVCSAAGALQAQVVGPARGTLFVAGGGMRDPALAQQFIDLAGGPEARIVVIPTAGEQDEYTQDFEGLEAFRALGAHDLVVLHTRDRIAADSEEFVAPIRTADAVWFSGGRQWRLADAYLGTATERALWDLLHRGGTIGGSSAGATIQGSYLVRGDTKGNTIMMGDHEVGFGFLANTAIDQHLLRRNRQFDLIEVIETFPGLLGIGIDENTAILVQGDTFEVVGHGYVAIYDSQTMAGDLGRFYFLAPGDRFDLAKREARRGEGEGRPLEGVKRQAWPRP
jgi:cyanophycinase